MFPERGMQGETARERGALVLCSDAGGPRCGAWASRRGVSLLGFQLEGSLVSNRVLRASPSALLTL